MDLTHLLLSTQGRINRAKWWIGLGITIVATVLISWILFAMFSTNLFYSFPGRAVMFVINLAALGVTYALAAKRFHDRDKSAVAAQLVAAFMFVKFVLDLFGLTGDPFHQRTLDTVFNVIQIGIGIWYIVELGCLRGTPGDNQYGPDPLADRNA